MKATSLDAFEKYLPLAALFCVSLPHEEERKQMLLKLASRRCQQVSYWQASQLTLEKLSSLLEQASFFGEEAIIIDDMDRVSKEMKERILNYSPSFQKILFLGTAHLKTLGSLEKYYILDLEYEKPWDRKERLLQTVANFLACRGKTLTSEALNTLIETVGLEEAPLLAELEKAILLVGDKPHIEEKEILSLLSSHYLPSGWDISQRLVWREEPKGFFLSSVLKLDEAALLQLISQVRFQLQMGLLLSEGSTDLVFQYFPQVRKALVDTLSSQAKKIGFEKFKHRLLMINELEFQTRKNSHLEVSLLWDFYIGKWV